MSSVRLWGSWKPRRQPPRGLEDILAAQSPFLACCLQGLRVCGGWGGVGWGGVGWG